MLKIILYAITACFPSLGYAEEINTKPVNKLNLEIRSTNICSNQQALTQVNNHQSLPSICQNQNYTTGNESHLVNNEVTTWLRLKGRSQKTRMIGLGFRFQVAEEGMVHIKVRGGGVQFRFQTTFWGW
jgi:hypothetical protein